VLVARSPRQAASTVTLLAARGAIPVAFPLIDVEPVLEPSVLAVAADALASRSYDVVAFTSANGVGFFEEALGGLARPFGALLANVRIAAVGPATSVELERRGVRAAVVAERFVAEELAHAILALEPRPRRVLFPRALDGREALPEALRRAGVEVDVLPVYRTVEATRARRASLLETLAAVDAVLLTSASSARALASLLGVEAREVLSRLTLASIGPVTTEAALAAGLLISVTSSESTVAGLVAALERHLATAP